MTTVLDRDTSRSPIHCRQHPNFDLSEFYPQRDPRLTTQRQATFPEDEHGRWILVWVDGYAGSLHNVAEHTTILEFLDTDIHWWLCGNMHISYHPGTDPPVSARFPFNTRTKLGCESSKSTIRVGERSASGNRKDRSELRREAW